MATEYMTDQVSQYDNIERTLPASPTVRVVLGLQDAPARLWLGIAAFAYRYARRRAHDRRYSFGTGKISALGGFGSAVSLAVIALFVLAESAGRLASPVTIRFDEAIGVAVVGLLVNLVSALLLSDHEHVAEHGNDHHRDHNLRGAYLHVLADAFTSILAIGASQQGSSSAGRGSTRSRAFSARSSSPVGRSGC